MNGTGVQVYRTYSFFFFVEKIRSILGEKKNKTRQKILESMR